MDPFITELSPHIYCSPSYSQVVMPPVRRNKQLTSSLEEASSRYCHNDISAPTIQLNSLSLAPTPSVVDSSHDTSPPPPVKKKRSHGKARPPGHIPRPPNAFIIFRTEYIKAQATQDSTPEVSKNLGEMWRNLSPSEKRPWIQKAEEAKLLHQEEHPGYKYKPIHRRDEFGNCIRKPRSPNRPRVKKPANSADVLEHLPESFQWLEAKPSVEFPNAALPSDASSVSSPPPSPSPGPSLHGPSPSTSYLLQRRSSSVPLAGPDETFFFGAATSSGYSSSSGFHTGHVRRLSKRPSTSMDFMCAGLGHSEVYGLTNSTETYLSPNDSSSWRLGHRRSISAPDFGGELPNFTFPSHNVPQEANLLTPINPVFGNVFDRFSWTTPQTLDSSSQNASTNFAPMHSSALSNKQQEYITVQIPPTTNASASNLSCATSPPISTPSSQLSSIPAPAILHPAPVATFDLAAFEEQIHQFELDAAASQGEYGDPLGVVVQTCIPDAGAVYNADAQFFIPVGVGHTAATAVQGTGATVAHSPSDYATLPPRPADSLAADLQGYQEGVCYTRRCPEITPPQVLDFNELIVDSY